MKPSEADYADLIDSLVHTSDIEAVNASVVDGRINAYDTAQKAQTAGAYISTVGDLLNILKDFGPLANVKELLDEANGEVNWATISDKPNSINVVWEEHIINVDLYQQPAFTSIESISAIDIVNTLAQNIIAGKKWVILDISITQVSVPLVSLSFPSYPASRIRSIKIGVSPRISFV